LNCQFKMEDGTSANCPREGRNEVNLVELEPDPETGIDRETDKVTKFYLCDEHLEEMHYRYHPLYFAKKYEDETLFDSTRGFDSLSEAMEVAIAGGYQVIEERLDARPDHPLSGTFVQSHAVIVAPMSDWKR
jgi:hypothetical protein